MKRKIVLSSIPVKADLVVIVVFGLIPGAGFTLYKHRDMSRQLIRLDEVYVVTLKTEFRRKLDTRVNLIA